MSTNTTPAPQSAPAAAPSRVILTGSPDEIVRAKFQLLQRESALAKARAAVTSAEVDLKVAEGILAGLLAPLPPLSPLAARALAGFRELTQKYTPHPCGGFTTDDLAFVRAGWYQDDEGREAIEELERARLIRYAGHDDDDAIGTCYELTEDGK